MATVTPTAIRIAAGALKSAVETLRDGTGEVPVETVLQGLADAAQGLINACDAVAVGGGIAVGRTFGNDPVAQTVGTTPVKITGWAAPIESRGVQSDAANGRLTIQEGGAGHFDVEYNIAFKGTNGRGYIAGVRVSRGGVESFETDTFDEEALIAANQVGHLDAFGRITNLQAGDWIELWIVASAASSSFVLRQAQLRIVRVDSP